MAAVKFQGATLFPDLVTKTLLRSFPLNSGAVSISNDSEIATRRCNCYNLYNKLIPYADAWKWQKTMVEKHTSAIENGLDVDDAVVILQHPPVYTLGTHSSEDNILFDMEQPPCDLYRTERGGEVTYHGPGQLVMYPILNLRYQQTDLHWYLRSLEEVVIRALWSACMIEARRIKGLTGVWVGDKKVAAIGIRVSRWISYHGLALNVTTDLAPFRRIIPCGINDRPVGTVLEILQDPSFIHSSEMKMYTHTDHLHEINCHSLLNMLHEKLLSEFSEVFGLDLFTVPADSLVESELCEVQH